MIGSHEELFASSDFANLGIESGIAHLLDSVTCFASEILHH